MDDVISIVAFNEKKIKRLPIDRPLSSDEIKHSRIRIGIDMMRDYDPAKHEFEIIRKDKQ